jgi:hypothetical protein
MEQKMKLTITNKMSVIVCILTLLLSGCKSTSSNSSPESAVEAYLKALVAQDSNLLSTLSCSDWEPNAIMELDSFQAVEVRLEGLSCTNIGVDGDFTLVNCAGNIIATYNGEDQNIDLASRNYQVIEQNGTNLVCGYQ